MSYFDKVRNKIYVQNQKKCKRGKLLQFVFCEQADTKMTGSPGKPIPYEAPPPPRNLKEKIVAATRKFHLNYYMVTSLYMMEPMERAIISKNHEKSQ